MTLSGLLIVLSIAPLGAPPQAGFGRVEKGMAGAPARLLRVVESDGSVLEARGDRLVRIRGGEVLELSSTVPGGTGEVRDLASDPAGGTWIAAEQGIFLAAPEVRVVDPLSLKKGAPQDPPIGVHVDRKRRLWIATDRSFGVVDAGTLDGRTFTSADGLPEPPYHGLATAADGSLLLHARDGLYRYRPDTGPPPTVAVAAANGKPFLPGRPVSFEYPQRLVLDLAGTATGGASFRVLPSERGRYRVGSLEGSRAVLERIDPGRRRVDLVAVDRDLNVSQPVSVEVDVSWPFYFRPSFVLPVGLGMGVTVLAGFLLAARRWGGGRPAYARAAVSAFLAPVLGLQLLAALIPHARGWPFVGFSMYTSTSREGRVVGNRVLEMIGRDGTARPVDTWKTFAAYPTQVIHPLMTRGDEAARQLLRNFNKKGAGAPMEGIRIRVYRHRLTADGPVRVAPMTVFYYREDRAHGSR